MDGYIKLYRKSIENGWLKNGDLWRFWCYCLLKATHKKTTVVIGWQQVELEPGQFPFGRRKASKDLAMSEQTIRTCLKNLENMKNLTIKSTNKFSIISIVNWDSYQSQESEINHQTNPSLTHAQPTPNHIQEHKNKRRKEYSPDFELFYSTYPLKKDPDKAWVAWQKRNGDRPDVSVLIEAINKQIAWRKNAKPGKFIPEWKYPASWLNAGSWKDQVEIEPFDPFRQ